MNAYVCICRKLLSAESNIGVNKHVLLMDSIHFTHRFTNHRIEFGTIYGKLNLAPAHCSVNE